MTPAEIILVKANGKKPVLSSNAIRNARKLYGENRKRFLDKTTHAMYDAEEIIVLQKIGVNRNTTNKPHDPHYNTAFQEFIENNPRFTRLDK